MEAGDYENRGNFHHPDPGDLQLSFATFSSQFRAAMDKGTFQGP
jgi:hypothetical protein